MEPINVCFILCTDTIKCTRTVLIKKVVGEELTYDSCLKNDGKRKSALKVLVTYFEGAQVTFLCKPRRSVIWASQPPHRISFS